MVVRRGGWLTLLVASACRSTAPAPVVRTIVEPCPPSAPADPLLDQARARAIACAGAEAVDAVDPHLLLFVAAGYGDLFESESRSLDFTTERLTTAQARALVCLVPEYNTPFGAPVSEAMQAFAGRVSGWRFGRASSPVLYIDLPYWTTQREGQDPLNRGERISDEENASMVEELRAAFVDDAHASEFSADAVMKRTLRAWWD